MSEPVGEVETAMSGEPLGGAGMSPSDIAQLLDSFGRLRLAVPSTDGATLLKELRFFQRRLKRATDRHKELGRIEDGDFVHNTAIVFLSRAEALDAVVSTGIAAGLALVDFAPQVRSLLELTCVYVGSSIERDGMAGSKHLVEAMGRDHSSFMNALFALLVNDLAFLAVADELGTPTDFIASEVEHHRERGSSSSAIEVSWGKYFGLIKEIAPELLSSASGSYWNILNKLVHLTSLSVMGTMSDLLLEEAANDVGAAELFDQAKKLMQSGPIGVEAMLQNVLRDCNSLLLMKGFAHADDDRASTRVLKVRKLLSPTRTILASFSANPFSSH